MDANKKWTRQRIVQFLAFSLLIFVLPAGSWYYLRTGLNKRLEAKAELRDLGKAPVFSFQNLKSEPVSLASFSGKLALFAFPKTNSNTSVFDQEKSLLAQYQNRSDIVLLSIVADSVGVAAKIRAAENQKPNAIWHHLAAGDAAFSKMMAEKSASSGRQILDEKLIALVDTTGSIRRFYDASDRADMVKLVNHIGLLLPSRD